MARKSQSPKAATVDGGDEELPLWARLDPLPRRSKEFGSILALLRNMPIAEDLEPLRTVLANSDVATCLPFCRRHDSADRIYR